MLIYFAVKASAGDLAEMLPNTKTFLWNSTPCENPVEMSNITYVDLTGDNPDSKAAVRALQVSDKCISGHLSNWMFTSILRDTYLILFEIHYYFILESTLQGPGCSTPNRSTTRKAL
jgi:hypothetical protein